MKYNVVVLNKKTGRKSLMKSYDKFEDAYALTKAMYNKLPRNEDVRGYMTLGDIKSKLERRSLIDVCGVGDTSILITITTKI